MTAKRILVVDDAGLVRRFYRHVLEAHGFAVEEAMNGIEALERLLADDGFDLLIVDINMPQMDGLTFIEKLRSQASPAASVPALVTSTEAQVHDTAAARRAGANFFLPKPVKPEVLLTHVALMCGVAP